MLRRNRGIHVFDNEHRLGAGEMEGGAVWEQLLLLAYCPIVALSAIVGNPVEFEQVRALSFGLLLSTVEFITVYCYSGSRERNLVTVSSYS